VLTYVAFVD
jgi:hypothetical protein